MKRQVHAMSWEFNGGQWHQEDPEEQPPIVELTEAEKKQFFIKSVAQFFFLGRES